MSYIWLFLKQLNTLNMQLSTCTNYATIFWNMQLLHNISFLLYIVTNVFKNLFTRGFGEICMGLSVFSKMLLYVPWICYPWRSDCEVNNLSFRVSSRMFVLDLVHNFLGVQTVLTQVEYQKRHVSCSLVSPKKITLKINL